ncbi:MAG: glutamate--tRNA ligase [Candidatus Edwardsbacteria bacterium]
MSEVRVRIAPSPSGYLHVGTARTALFNWLFAKNQNGKFILRIEDTDSARSSSEMISAILESLQWLGLQWDEQPYHQSARLDIYRDYSQKLLKDNKAYYCYCSPELLDKKRESAKQAKKAPRYDRTCLSLTEEEREELNKKGMPKAIRFFVSLGKTVYHDLVHGDLEREHSEIEDFIILRSDGVATYNFACVVDDVEMRISHIIRGDDHISNTFKQILLYQALGIEPPQFAHLPLILTKNRAKLSKRFGAVSVTEYRDEGYLPETMVNFLALLGWAPGDDREILPKKELVRLFSLEKVSSANPVFDLEKLEWMNGEYIRKLNKEELTERVIPFLLKENLISSEEEISGKREWLTKVVWLLRERCHKLTDFVHLGRFFFTDNFEYDAEVVKKQFTIENIATHLQELQKRWGELKDFNKENLEKLLRDFAGELNIKPANLIHPVRVAVSGLSVGPGLFEMVEVLGREKVLERITRAIKYVNRLNL